MRRFQIARRQLLRGMFGGVSYSLGLPILNAMLNSSGNAFADGSTFPQRFGTFYWGGGVHLDTWVPTQTGTGWQVPFALEGLATNALKPYITVVSGFNHRSSSPGHIPSRGIALSSSHDLDKSTNGVGTYRGQKHPEPSIDEIVSKGIGGKWAGVSICMRGPYKSNSSWVQGGTSKSFDASPAGLYTRLFSNQPVLDNSDKLFRAKVLDAVREDAKSLNAKLGSADKQRMEQHLQGISEIEKELSSQVPVGQCSATNPGGGAYGDGSPDEKKADKTKVMASLMATGLACDAIRSFCFEFSGTQSGASYWEVGYPNSDHHDLTHGEPEPIRKITRFIMDQFGVFAEKLRAIPEGTGNLLDHTLIFGTSELATARSHNYKDHPLLFVGKGGKIKAGIHYRHPDSVNNFDAPKVLLTAVRAMGVNRPSLGQTEAEGRLVSQDVPALFE
jgi:Protein of unknown function (DUF1552)